jgi:CpeS-like protein
MDIQEFFEISAGKWFSQRTSTYPGYSQPETGKTDLRIGYLAKNDPLVANLAQEFGIASGLAICGLELTWDGQIELTKVKQAGSALLIAIADPDHPQQGTLIRSWKGAEKKPLSSRYQIGVDDALTLFSEEEALIAEERLWYASPNLRLRTTILTQSNHFRLSSFTTEIRLGVTQANPPRSTAQ